MFKITWFEPIQPSNYEIKISQQVAIKDANVKLQMAEYQLEANMRLWEGPRFTTKLKMTQYNVKGRSSSGRHTAIGKT